MKEATIYTKSRYETKYKIKIKSRKDILEKIKNNDMIRISDDEYCSGSYIGWIIFED